MSGNLVSKKLNAFNTMINQFLFTDVKIIEEDKCINLLCSFPQSWDSLVVAIGRNNATLQIDDVVAYIIS